MDQFSASRVNTLESVQPQPPPNDISVNEGLDYSSITGTSGGLSGLDLTNPNGTSLDDDDPEISDSSNNDLSPTPGSGSESRSDSLLVASVQQSPQGSGSLNYSLSAQSLSPIGITSPGTTMTLDSSLLPFTVNNGNETSSSSEDSGEVAERREHAAGMSQDVSEYFRQVELLSRIHLQSPSSDSQLSAGSSSIMFAIVGSDNSGGSLNSSSSTVGAGDDSSSGTMNNNRTELPPSSTTQDNTDDDNNTPPPHGSSPPNAASTLNAGSSVETDNGGGNNTSTTMDTMEMGGGGQEVNEENTNPNMEVNSNRCLLAALWRSLGQLLEIISFYQQK